MIYENIINSFGKKRNYFLLKNISDMINFSNDIINDINDKNIFKKIKDMVKIYNKIEIFDISKFSDDEIKNINKKKLKKEKKLILRIKEEKNKEQKENLNNNENNELTKAHIKIQEKYLKEHGGENKYINNYPLYIFDDDQKVYLPKVKNGRIVLRKDIPSIGLKNVGGSCFMNATLECLIHIKELSEHLLSAFYFRFPRHLEDYPSKHPLSIEYMSMLSQVYFPKLYENNNNYYAPYSFKNLISKMNPLFKGIKACDPKDFLQFFVETIHSELKMATQVFYYYNIDQRNDGMAMKYFYDSYVTQNKSPIHDYLYAINKIQTFCLNCHTVKYIFQSYNFLNFILKEVKIDAISRKKEQNKNFKETDYILNLEDCFIYNEKTEKFEGDNQMYCNDCFGLRDTEYQSSIFTTPTILAIVLNRGIDNSEFKERFNFGIDIDIKKYIHNPNCKHGKYYLIGMVVSSGKNHFIAYCRLDKDSEWFCYDDDSVFECDNFENELLEYNPYILFYHYDNE